MTCYWGLFCHVQNIQGAPTIYLHIHCFKDLKRSQNAQKKGNFLHLNIWWYLSMLKLDFMKCRVSLENVLCDMSWLVLQHFFIIIVMGLIITGCFNKSYKTYIYLFPSKNIECTTINAWSTAFNEGNRFLITSGSGKITGDMRAETLPLSLILFIFKSSKSEGFWVHNWNHFTA